MSLPGVLDILCCSPVRPFPSPSNFSKRAYVRETLSFEFADEVQEGRLRSRLMTKILEQWAVFSVFFLVFFWCLVSGSVAVCVCAMCFPFYTGSFFISPLHCIRRTLDNVSVALLMPYVHGRLRVSACMVRSRDATRGVS